MKLYPVGIVGESNYQAAILRSREGEPARIFHEPDNPYDDLALRVENSDGDTIGYIAKSSWVRDAVHTQGRGVAATIATIAAAEGALLGVVLNVTLTDDPVFERSYLKREAPVDRDLGARILSKLWNGLTGPR